MAESTGGWYGATLKEIESLKSFLSSSEQAAFDELVENRDAGKRIAPQQLDVVKRLLRAAKLGEQNSKIV